MSGHADAPRRRPTRVVRVGDVALGGPHPLRVQSMTTTDTRDTAATAAQIERLVDAGCEIVRVATPSVRDADALGDVGDELGRRGVRVPLVADVHFVPAAAFRALEVADKVRINPGNYVDRKRFAVRGYSDAEYADELARVAEVFAPLARRARQLGRALRIGTNHGSLSDRIVNRFGDSPLGMVESALEFLDVCEAEGLRDVVFSMKSSHPIVMVEAYRLLARRLDARSSGERTGYPLHLGVTEAGLGRDGRVKSAIGIGTLLEEGLGDTLRVSLTEDPVREIPVARALAERARPSAEPGAGLRALAGVSAPEARANAVVPAPPPPRRDLVRVELELGPAPADPARAAEALASALAREPSRPCEGVLLDVDDAAALARVRDFRSALRRLGVSSPVAVRVVQPVGESLAGAAERLIARVTSTTPDEWIARAARDAAHADAELEWAICVAPSERAARIAQVVALGRAAGREAARVSLETGPFVAAHVEAAAVLARCAPACALALRHPDFAGASEDASLVHLAAELGAVLVRGLGACVSIGGVRPWADRFDLAYRILQGARLRTTRAEFISCPSCGRTQFDLAEVTARIERRTAHLRDVKIAVMGCNVNGPGELADADFGYVGSAPGRVALYVGRALVERSVRAEDAEGRLVELIRAHGRWREPLSTEPACDAAGAPAPVTS